MTEGFAWGSAVDYALAKRLSSGRPNAGESKLCVCCAMFDCQREAVLLIDDNFKRGERRVDRGPHPYVPFFSEETRSNWRALHGHRSAREDMRACSEREGARRARARIATDPQRFEDDVQALLSSALSELEQRSPRVPEPLPAVDERRPQPLRADITANTEVCPLGAASYHPGMIFDRRAHRQQRNRIELAKTENRSQAGAATTGHGGKAPAPAPAPAPPATRQQQQEQRQAGGE